MHKSKNTVDVMRITTVEMLKDNKVAKIEMSQ